MLIIVKDLKKNILKKVILTKYLYDFMLISIITPTFNSSLTIKENVESIIKQKYNNYEHIIVDNESSDNTLEIIISAYKKVGFSEKLRLISEKDNGISDAFNKGIKMAKGEIIGILNSDDYFFDENSLKRIIEAFMENDVLFVHGNVFFKDEVHGSNIRRPIMGKVETAMPYNHPTLYFRKQIYNQFGIYSLKYKYVMDYEFIIRIAAANNSVLSKGKYIEGTPISVMRGGGASWKYEKESLKEIKIALAENGLWNGSAKRALILRELRLFVKNCFYKVGLKQLVIVWRNLKWKE